MCGDVCLLVGCLVPQVKQLEEEQARQAALGEVAERRRAEVENEARLVSEDVRIGPLHYRPPRPVKPRPRTVFTPVNVLPLLPLLPVLFPSRCL